MKLVFYGGDDEGIERVDRALVNLCSHHDPSMTFIPASSLGASFEFRQLRKRFLSCGLKRMAFMPIDVSLSKILLDQALESDIIYLGGGNTYYFLHYLRSQKLLTRLKEFARKGGILAGLSAGGILLTPHIQTASFPDFDCDENDIGIKNLKALGLSSFEFFPHFITSKRYKLALESHSQRSKNPILAVSDGAGVVFNGEDVEFLGASWLFVKGQGIKLTP